MYKKAAQEKYRFGSSQGTLTVEDLWDLPLLSNKAGRASLDDIAKDLNKRLQQAGDEKSFVDDSKRVDSHLQTAFDIVLDVIATKKAENEVARKTSETKAKKQQILEIIARKQDEKLAGASIEELTAMVEAL